LTPFRRGCNPVCPQRAVNSPAGSSPVEPPDAPLRTAAPSSAVANQIIDSYELSSGILTIPLVRVGTHFYQDVRITVGTILSLGTAQGVSGVFDSYDRATNRLTIPVVKVGDTLYYNARPGSRADQGLPVLARCALGCAASYAFARCWKSSRV
jgi:hypothetical protein